MHVCRSGSSECGQLNQVHLFMLSGVNTESRIRFVATRDTSGGICSHFGEFIAENLEIIKYWVQLLSVPFLSKLKYCRSCCGLTYTCLNKQ